VKKIVVTLFVILAGGLWGKSPSAEELAQERDRIDVHGFLSQGFLQSDRNNFYAKTKAGTFQFNEFGINFATELTDRLRTGLQLLSRDLGNIGNNKVDIDWAYAEDSFLFAVKTTYNF